jgi:hypothetical protein
VEKKLVDLLPNRTELDYKMLRPTHISHICSYISKDFALSLVSRSETRDFNGNKELSLHKNPGVRKVSGGIFSRES